MNQHTPGPWTVETVNAGHADPSITALGIVGRESTIVARMPAEYVSRHAVWTLAQSNARLIAKAPEMHLLIRQFEAWSQASNHSEAAILDFGGQARALLREIEGD